MRYLIVIFGSILLIGIVILCSINFMAVGDIKGLRIFHYSTVDGMAIWDGVNYSIDYENGKYIAKIKNNGESSDNTKKVEISKYKVRKLESILNKYRVGSWNGFRKNNKNVLDGSSFNLYIKLEDDTTIEASGYMKWPENYRKVREEVESFFKGLS